MKLSVGFMPARPSRGKPGVRPVDNPIDHLRFAEIGSVDDFRAGRDRQRAHRPARIPFVALDNLPKNLLIVSHLAPCPKLGNPASRPFGGSRIKIELQLGVGEYDRSLIPPFGNEVAVFCADSFLLLYKLLAHGPDRGYV